MFNFGGKRVIALFLKGKRTFQQFELNSSVSVIEQPRRRLLHHWSKSLLVERLSFSFAVCSARWLWLKIHDSLNLDDPSDHCHWPAWVPVLNAIYNNNWIQSIQFIYLDYLSQALQFCRPNKKWSSPQLYASSSWVSLLFSQQKAVFFRIEFKIATVFVLFISSELGFGRELCKQRKRTKQGWDYGVVKRRSCERESRRSTKRFLRCLASHTLRSHRWVQFYIDFQSES